MKNQKPEASIDPDHMPDLVRESDSSVRIERISTRVCPFLNYIPIGYQCEMITCRAYRNRMVLGGRRLHEVCETVGYRHCEYYLRPRVAS